MNLFEESAPRTVQFSWSHITCGEACWHAKDTDCKCSCGGKNHGIFHRGGIAERTCKLNGHAYKLVAVDSYSNVLELQRELLAGYGVMRCYDYYGNGEYKHQTYLSQFACRGDKDVYGFPLVAKQATLSQCQRWRELSDHKNITEMERSRKAPYLLWQLITPPEPIKHNCGA